MPAATPASTGRLRDGVRRALRSPWLHPLNNAEAINNLLGDLSPMWSLSEIRTEVIARIQETPDTISLLLRPNRHWPGFRAGQHVTLSVEIDGVREQRVYSLSSAAPHDRTLRLTIKRQPQGRVSNWLHDALRVGEVIALGEPAGDFTLPEITPPLLLLSAGSGITPIRALLDALRVRQQAGETIDAILVHVCRSDSELIFADELDTLARAMPGLRVQILHSAGRRPDIDALLAQVPDYAMRLSYLCGPAGLIAAVERRWQRDGIATQLRLERFAMAPRAIDDGGRAEVRCTRSERMFSAATADALLPAAESAGLKPAYGCRIGICRTCLCKKKSGVVENLVSGERSDAGEEWIRLCVSAPRSDLELDL